MEFTDEVEPTVNIVNPNDFVQITDSIDVMGTIELVKDDTAGAISTFMGTTRDNFEGTDRATLLNFKCIWTVLARYYNTAYHPVTYYSKQ